MQAVSSLVKHTDVNAITVVARFQDDDSEDFEIYRQGKVSLDQIFWKRYMAYVSLFFHFLPSKIYYIDIL
jgi:hypothetical protein